VAGPSSTMTYRGRCLIHSFILPFFHSSIRSFVRSFSRRVGVSETESAFGRGCLRLLFGRYVRPHGQPAQGAIDPLRRQLFVCAVLRQPFVQGGEVYPVQRLVLVEA
jgi:hypothetical protein